MSTRLALAISAAFLTLPERTAAADWAAVSAIFEARCVRCHAGDVPPQGLALTSHAAVMAGAWTGPVVLPDAPEDSPLYQRITGQIRPQMPLDGPPFLAEAEIALLRDWIASGAPGPADDAPEPVVAPPPDPYGDGIITYPEVEQIFLTRCIECHSDNSKTGGPPEGLRLTSLEEILAGGERIAVIPGNPEASEILRRVEGRADPRMPYDGPPWLTEAQIALLRDWIAGGARDGAGTAAPVPVGAEVRYRGVMTGPNEIDGIGFAVTGATRVDDRPGVGQQAEVRGRVTPDGSITATRLRAR